MTKYFSWVVLCLVFTTGCSAFKDNNVATKSLDIADTHLELGEVLSIAGSTINVIIPCSREEAASNNGKCKHVEGRQISVIPSSGVLSQVGGPAIGAAANVAAGYVAGNQIRKGLENQPTDSVSQQNNAVQNNSVQQPRRHHR